jgi:exodeoxyribonuclease V beta subunit
LLGELARSRCDLHELVSQLRRWIANGEAGASSAEELDVQRNETDADAVRILTIHKAKGLESPFVFVFGGTSGTPPGDVKTLRDAAGRAILVGALDAHTTAALDAANDAENQRLAYVGLTRAQVRLYLPVYSDGALKKNAAYEPVQRCLAPLAARASIGGRALFESIEVPLGTGVPAEAPPDTLAHFVPPPPPRDGELAPLPIERTGLAMYSYTRLAHDAVALASSRLEIDPAEFDVDEPGGEVAPDDLPPGADSGLLLHDVLEVADLAAARRLDLAEWYARPDVSTQLADAARRRGVDRRYLPHAAQLVHRALHHPLALVDGHTLPPLATASAFAREVEFSYPLATRRGMVRGYIDALVAWEDRVVDGMWIVDYKSDVLSGPDPAAAAQTRVQEHYLVQARLYAIAADRMRGRRRLAGLLFAFLRHDLVVPIRIDGDTLAGWHAWLAEVTARPLETAS